MLIHLVARNNKVFLRDKLQVFFSLLSVSIVIGLYVIFLQKTQLDAIEAVVPLTTAIKVMVNEWMMSGLISIVAVTTTLGVFGIYIKDLETKAIVDFLTTSMPRTSIHLSYAVSAFFIGFLLTFIAFVASQLFLVATGGRIMTWMEMIQTVGIILLSVLLSSVLSLFVVQFVHSQNAFATVSTIVGTVIGFLCGVYVPVGILPNFVQKIIYFFPVSHTTVLLRQLFMQDSIAAVFPKEEAKIDYMHTFGVHYELNGAIIEPWMSLFFIVATIVVFGVISGVIFRWKNK